MNLKKNLAGVSAGARRFPRPAAPAMGRGFLKKPQRSHIRSANERSLLEYVITNHMTRMVKSLILLEFHHSLSSSGNAGVTSSAGAGMREACWMAVR